MLPSGNASASKLTFRGSNPSPPFPLCSNSLCCTIKPGSHFGCVRGKCLRSPLQTKKAVWQKQQLQCTGRCFFLNWDNQRYAGKCGRTGKSTSGSELEPEAQNQTLFNAFLQSTDIQNIIQPTSSPGVSIIPANRQVTLIEKDLTRLDRFETRFSSILKPVSTLFDFAIFDCPPFLGSVTLNTLTAADFLIIPTQAEYYSIYALRNMMQLVRTVRTRFNTGLTYRLLITTIRPAKPYPPYPGPAAADDFRLGCLAKPHPGDTRLRKSVEGKTVFNWLRTQELPARYRSLSQELLEYKNDRESYTGFRL